MASILVIDDDAAIREMLDLRLGLAGHDVRFAHNGQVGVDEAFARPADLILLDMHMPVMDGHTAARTLRAGGYGGLICALTASAFAADTGHAIDAGCDAFISKPVGENFEQMIERIIETGGRP